MFLLFLPVIINLTFLNMKKQFFYLIPLFFIIVFSFSFYYPGVDQPSKNTKKRQIEILTTDNFDAFVQGKLVLVDFWATWCHPCRLQGPILDEVNSEIGDKVKIGKVNVDENKMLSKTFGIASIPTLLIFKKGQVVERLQGLQQKDQLIAVLKKHMN